MHGIALAAAAAGAVDWVARWLAIGSLAVSVVTVVVTVTLWRKDGWKPNVELADLGSRETFEQFLERQAGREGADGRVFVVTVTNEGRLACSVKSVEVRGRAGRQDGERFRAEDDGTPHTLKPSESFDVEIHVADAKMNALLSSSDGELTVQAVVQVGRTWHRSAPVRWYPQGPRPAVRPAPPPSSPSVPWSWLQQAPVRPLPDTQPFPPDREWPERSSSE